jgi:hypothetical protein
MAIRCQLRVFRCGIDHPVVPKVILSLLVKGKSVPHHEVMDEYEDIETTVRILPGVDITLWLRIITFALIAAIAAVVALLVA